MTVWSFNYHYVATHIPNVSDALSNNAVNHCGGCLLKYLLAFTHKITEVIIGTKIWGFCEFE